MRTMERAHIQVKDLAEAFGKQSKYSNQLWLALIGAAVVANFPHRTAQGVELPFSLGVVNQDVFSPAAFLIVSVLTVAYCVAFAEANSAVRFAHSQLDRLDSNQHRRLYDFLTVAIFARVAPLARLIVSSFNNWSPAYKIAAVYYVALKLVANVILLGIPTASLITAYCNLSARADPWPPGAAMATWIDRFSTLTLVVTAAAIIQIVVAEVRHDAHVTRLYWNRQIPL
jgi:hypothetical protein